jgi:hypothetical protein
MLSIADSSAFRRLLLVALLASCLFALSLQAQTASPPCENAPVPDFSVDAPAQSPIQLAAIPCGAAGQICCPGSYCNSGLACNSNGICRVPCGAAGQRCCTNQTCNAGLACNSSSICRTCGGNGDICCSGNSCSSGLTCTGGRCSPPCGGAYQACCSGGGCGAGLACAFAQNQCLPCGFLGEYCCPGIPQCSEGTCKVPGTCQP